MLNGSSTRDMGSRETHYLRKVGTFEGLCTQAVVSKLADLGAGSLGQDPRVCVRSGCCEVECESWFHPEEMKS